MVFRPLSVALLSLTLILSAAACVKRMRSEHLPTLAQMNDQRSTASVQTTAANQQISPRININTASVKELEKLPGIGRGLAERIIEHREKYGPFRRPEHLIMVRGISDKRFRVLRDSVTIE
jgi:competence ComEA-like helix-hairpin-helix protein